MSEEQNTNPSSVSQQIQADSDVFGAGRDLTINNYYRSGSEYQQTHKAKLAHLPPWKRPMIWTGGAVVALVIAVAAQDPLLSHSYYSAVPSLGSLSLIEYRGTDELIVPIYNPQPADEQIQEIGVDIQFLPCALPQHRVVAPRPRPVKYAIDGDLGVLTGSAVVGVVTPESGADSGASIRAIGSVNTAGYCANEIKLGFRPPALLLGGKTTTLISVIMPKNNIFTISGQYRREVPDSNETPALKRARAFSVQIPNFTGGFWTATVTVRDSFGVQSSSCQMSANATC